jgi:cytochrome c oxidase cbb3-type subunit 1
MYPYYVIRMLGGLFFLLGALIMVYNLIRTVRESPRTETAAGTPVLAT